METKDIRSDYQKLVYGELKLLSCSWEESDFPIPLHPARMTRDTPKQRSKHNSKMTKYWNDKAKWRTDREKRFITFQPKISWDIGMIGWMSVKIVVLLDLDFIALGLERKPGDQLPGMWLKGHNLYCVKERFPNLGVMLDWLDDRDEKYITRINSGYIDDGNKYLNRSPVLYLTIHLEIKR